jgi:hypothetical protein
MAVLAEQDKPAAGYVTDATHPYSGLVDQQNKAYSESIAADVGFGVGAVAAVTATVLYFGRRRNPAPAPADHVSVSAAPVLGGGVLSVQGSF